MKSLFFAGTNGSGKSTFRAYTMSDLLSGAIIIDPDVLTKKFSDSYKGGREAIRIFN